MIHPSPIIAASDVVEITAPRPAVLETYQQAVASHDPRGATQINSNSYGFSTEFRREQPWLRESVLLALAVASIAALPSVIAVTVILCS